MVTHPLMEWYYRWYYRLNPVIHLIMRPTLKLVDAHNHPLRGGIAAAIASGLFHYSLAFLFCWSGGVWNTLVAIPLVAHILFGIVMGLNLLFGVVRWSKRRPHHQRA